jgi:hypothetical protein
MKLAKLLTLVFALLLAAGAPLAQAQSEPTVNQIYQTAESGDLLKARSMIDQVLRKHPNSAKAHYVKAELAARQNDAATAQSELATAERIDPGLPFAKPQAVQALRAQVQHETSGRSAARNMGAPGDYPAPAATSRGHGMTLGMLVVLAAVVAGVIALMRTRRAMTVPPAGGMSQQGYGPGTPPPYGPGGPGYGQPYGQPGYGPGYYPPGGVPQQPSMGSTIARGIGTGLAVGAGAVAAEEIGRRLFHHDGTPAGFANEVPTNIVPDPNLNPDMGGQDFGMADNNASWDDNGGVADGGWDDNGGGGDDWNT